jgi:hypothetical protein
LHEKTAPRDKKNDELLTPGPPTKMDPDNHHKTCFFMDGGILLVNYHPLPHLCCRNLGPLLYFFTLFDLVLPSPAKSCQVLPSPAKCSLAMSRQVKICPFRIQIIDRVIIRPGFFRKKIRIFRKILN